MGFEIQRGPAPNLMGAAMNQLGQMAAAKRAQEDERRAQLDMMRQAQGAALRQQAMMPELALRREQSYLNAADRQAGRDAQLYGQQMNLGDRAAGRQFEMAKQYEDHVNEALGDQFKADNAVRQQQHQRELLGQSGRQKQEEAMLEAELYDAKESGDFNRAMFLEEEKVRLKNPNMWERKVTRDQMERSNKLRIDIAELRRRSGVTMPKEQAEQLILQKNQELLGQQPGLVQRAQEKPSFDQVLAERTKVMEDGSLRIMQPDGTIDFRPPPKVTPEKKEKPPDIARWVADAQRIAMKPDPKNPLNKIPDDDMFKKLMRQKFGAMGLPVPPEYRDVGTRQGQGADKTNWSGKRAVELQSIGEVNTVAPGEVFRLPDGRGGVVLRETDGADVVQKMPPGTLVVTPDGKLKTIPGGQPMAAPQQAQQVAPQQGGGGGMPQQQMAPEEAITPEEAMLMNAY